MPGIVLRGGYTGEQKDMTVCGWAQCPPPGDDQMSFAGGKISKEKLRTPCLALAHSRGQLLLTSKNKAVATAYWYHQY